MILPLVPLGLELLITKTITEQSVTLTAAVYSLGIGIASRSAALFSLTIVISFVFSCLFGVVIQAEYSQKKAEAQIAAHQPAAVANNEKKAEDGKSENTHDEVIQWSKLLAFSAIVLVTLIHMGERYNRHVVDRAPFFEFSLK
jgi:hypothetical protein